jgi:hypothetical protein
MRPVEEGELRAGTGDRVAVEQVVRGHVILIDALFRETHPKRARVEPHVGGYRASDGRDVVKSGEGTGGIRILCRLLARKRGRVHGVPIPKGYRAHAMNATGVPRVLDSLMVDTSKNGEPHCDRSFSSPG